MQSVAGVGDTGPERAKPYGKVGKPKQARCRSGVNGPSFKRSRVGIVDVSHVGLLDGSGGPMELQSVAGGEDTEPNRAMP